MGRKEMRGKRKEEMEEWCRIRQRNTEQKDILLSSQIFNYELWEK